MGESIVAAKEKELDDADDPTEYLAMEINDEIEHVLETTHEPTLKALFGIYLYEEIRDRFDTYAQEMTSEVAEDEPDRETFQKRLTIGLERGLPTILYHRSYTDHVDTQ